MAQARRPDCGRSDGAGGAGIRGITTYLAGDTSRTLDQALANASNGRFADLADFKAMDADVTEDPNRVIANMDRALEYVSTRRTELGAQLNRLDSAIVNLATAAESLTASRSRIQDADFAAETAALTRAQILQQAGTAMIVQANMAPQRVLNLLT